MSHSEAQEANGITIALVIASESGLPPENYMDYGNALAKTLSRLSSDQFSKVFEGTSYSQPADPDGGGSDDGGGESGGGEPEGDGGGGESEPEGDDGDDSGIAPPNNPATDQPLIDAINGSMPPGQLKSLLQDASPLSQAVLDAFVASASSLPNGTVMNVLEVNTPLPSSVYLDILTGDTGLNSGQLANLAVAQNGGGGGDDDDDDGGGDDDDDDGGGDDDDDGGDDDDDD